MTRINRTEVVFLNFFLRFSARDIPVLNATQLYSGQMQLLKMQLDETYTNM